MNKTNNHKVSLGQMLCNAISGDKIICNRCGAIAESMKFFERTDCDELKEMSQEEILKKTPVCRRRSNKIPNRRW